MAPHMGWGGFFHHPRGLVAPSLVSAPSSVQVEPNTKLFPAVFALPTSQNVIQFELGKLKVTPGSPPAPQVTLGGGSRVCGEIVGSGPRGSWTPCAGGLWV